LQDTHIKDVLKERNEKGGIVTSRYPAPHMYKSGAVGLSVNMNHSKSYERILLNIWKGHGLRLKTKIRDDPDQGV